MRSPFILALLLATSAMAASPETITITNKRDHATESLTNVVAWKGLPIAFTNCRTFSDSAGAVTQSLAGTILTVVVGQTPRVNVVTGRIDDVTGGLWSATATIPEDMSGDTAMIQVRLLDSSTNAVFYYPPKLITTRDPLTP